MLHGFHAMIWCMQLCYNIMWNSETFLLDKSWQLDHDHENMLMNQWNIDMTDMI